ncbi:Subtilisin-like protease SBT5.4 [Linum perenne]
MVLVNDFTTGNEVIADAHIFPASHVNYPTDYITSTKYVQFSQKPIAYITPLEIQIRKRRAPSMAAISSKEPNRITPKMLKGPTKAAFNTRRVQFNSVTGTSMSCPQVSWVVGFLRTLCSHWSPAPIKSAIMTTSD